MYTYTPTHKFLVLSHTQPAPRNKFLVLSPTESGPEQDETGPSSPISTGSYQGRDRSDSQSSISSISSTSSTYSTGSTMSGMGATFSPLAGGFLYLGHKSSLRHKKDASLRARGKFITLLPM